MSMYPWTVTISYCYESGVQWQNVWLYDNFSLYPVSKEGYVWTDEDKSHYYESGETIQANDDMVLYEVKKPSTVPNNNQNKTPVSPKTGDRNNLTLWLELILFSVTAIIAAGTIVILAKRRK